MAFATNSLPDGKVVHGRIFGRLRRDSVIKVVIGRLLLTVGGGEEGPCGWLKDRFGLSSQVIPHRLTELLSSSDQGTVERVSQAMFQMKKIVIADLEPAAAQ